MSEPVSAAEKLKQHFSHRVINQVRQVIDLWRQMPSLQWDKRHLADLILANEKLISFARRFAAVRHEKLALKLQQVLNHIALADSPNSNQLEEITDIIVALSKTALRHTDDEGAEKLIPNRKNIYIALSDTDQSLTVAEQMQYFGLRPELQRNADDFRNSLMQRHPAAIVMDIAFAGSGIELAQEVQQSRETPLPFMFTYQGEAPSLTVQLNAMRAGGIGLYEQKNVQEMISRLEELIDQTPEPAFKVLIVDDSRTQSTQTGNVLNKAGLITEAINNPLQVLDTLHQFSPDLVLMDMYMPECNGMELARVIRQQREYINLPIIFLSGEEDRERQLAAMAEGGDDFLTKPVEPRHLVTTVTNRVRRSRQLQDLIARDSLTGLLNHTHLLGSLETALRKHQDAPVSFVMVDIDHFKQVNDTYGHPTGDAVIRNLSLFLKQNLRKTDPIGRYGGEEFAIVMVDANAQQAAAKLDEIRNNFSRLIHDDKQLRVTFSCGIAEYRGESISELVGAADQALYRAKRNGRNQVHTA